MSVSALSHPNISFNYISNNQNKLHTSGNTNLKDIIYNVYGREITSNLLAVRASQGELSLDGFIENRPFQGETGDLRITILMAAILRAV